MAGTGVSLKRDAGIIGLLYFSLGGIIGSGWLFGAMYAAKQAGPWSIISWLIGAAVVLLLALVYAEIATMLPRSGALIHISHIGHGELVGRIWSWILFLSSVVTPPIEVMAILTYASAYWPAYWPSLLNPQTHMLTSIGFIAATVVLALVVAINFFAIKLVLWINNVATWWKLLVPAATIAILMIFSFHPSNLTFKLGTVDPAGMLTAVSTAGIIFSFLGFRLAINLGGETRNPGKYIPIAVIGSVLISTVIYVGLQIAFLLALRPSDIAHGWAALNFIGMAGPLAAIAIIVGAFWWAWVLYFDAIISPLGTAFIYSTNTSRLGMAMAEMGSAPKTLERLNRAGVPWVALIATFVIGAVFFFPFPSWQKLVGYVSSITVLSYGIGPVVLLILRRSLPGAARPFRLKAARWIAPAAFIASNWIIFWAGFPTNNFMFILLAVLFGLYILWFFLVQRRPVSELGWRHAWWVLPYFAGMWLLSRFGPTSMEGSGLISLGWDMLLIAVFSLVIMYAAVRSALPASGSRAYLERVRTIALPEEVEEGP